MIRLWSTSSKLGGAPAMHFVRAKLFQAALFCNVARKHEQIQAYIVVLEVDTADIHTRTIKN